MVTKRQQQEQQARQAAMQALQSRAWAADDPITVDDAVLFIAGRVHSHSLAWRGYRNDTRARVRQMVQIGLASKSQDVRLEADADGRLVFGTLMRWVYASQKLRETLRDDGTCVFAGLPGFENAGAGNAGSDSGQAAAHVQPVDPAQLWAALEEALVENVELKLEVARLQAENAVMRPDWEKAEDQRRKRDHE